EDETKKVTGIVTLFDIARQFQKLIEPFIELQQIELSLRNLIEAKIDNEKFLAFCTKTLPYRKAKSSDDLTFGDYLKVVNNAEFWELFNLDLDRKAFVEKLDTVRAIRNEVMHFKTKGVSRRDLKHLKDVSKFFRVLERFTLGSSKSDDADY